MKFFFILCSLISLNAIAAPKADLWAYWNVSDPKSTSVINHTQWQSILDNNLTVAGQNHLFNYAQISQQDKKTLKSYLHTLTQVDPRKLNKKEQFAYWVNLYNAETVQLILNHYPIESITKLGGFFSFGPWDQDLVSINNKTLSLNDIEHRILRPIWKDKRIHYAVNCASLGCPNLMTQAFTSTNTHALLEQAERAFITSNKGVNIIQGKPILSSIYDWYAVDFGGKQNVLKYLATFRPDIKQTNKKPSYQYNWALNKK